MSIPIKLFLLSIFFLTACASPSRWDYDFIASGDRKFDSGKLSYSCRDGICPFSFEVVETGGTRYGCFTLFSSKLQSNDLVLKIDELEYKIKGELHEGNQKLFLGKETLDLILKALTERKTVFFNLSGFTNQLEPEFFAPSYRQFNKNNPFYEKAFDKIKERLN